MNFEVIINSGWISYYFILISVVIEYAAIDGFLRRTIGGCDKCDDLTRAQFEINICERDGFFYSRIQHHPNIVMRIYFRRDFFTWDIRSTHVDAPQGIDFTADCHCFMLALINHGAAEVLKINMLASELNGFHISSLFISHAVDLRGCLREGGLLRPRLNKVLGKNRCAQACAPSC